MKKTRLTGSTPRCKQAFVAFVLASALMMPAAIFAGGSPPPPPAPPEPPAISSGTFNLLAYNVDGLPEILGGQSSSTHEAQSNAIAAFGPSLFAAQEDFCFHSETTGALTDYPYATEPSGACGFFDIIGWIFTSDIGDGLNRLGKNTVAFTPDDLYRETWLDCSNDSAQDCLTDKGFSVVRHRLSSSVTATIDVYNVHMDAGSTAADLAARASNFAQLANAIATLSAGKNVIVAGDLNQSFISAEFATATGLTDACAELSAGCSIDRVLYRSIDPSMGLSVTAVNPDPAGFAGLSDHDPVSAAFSWQSL